MQASENGNALLWTLRYKYSKNTISQAFSLYTVVFLSLAAMLVPAIVYRDIKIYCSNVKNIVFFFVTWEPSNESLLFFCITNEHRCTDFPSYLDFSKMEECAELSLRWSHIHIYGHLAKFSNNNFILPPETRWKERDVSKILDWTAWQRQMM